jgi:hypothetical protein
MAFFPQANDLVETIDHCLIEEPIITHGPPSFLNETNLEIEVERVT